MFFITFSGRGNIALLLILLGYGATRGVFSYFSLPSYYEWHVLTVNGVSTIVSGLVCLAYAYYLHKNPPKVDSIKLRDPKTGEFRSIAPPMNHSILSMPIELLGPLLAIVGVSMWLWDVFHPKL